MLKKLNNIKVVMASGILTAAMFVVVMFLVNPMIDGKDGFEVILLQLAFDKEAGVNILNSWGDSGVSNFNRYIFTDYLYAVSYSIFFASLLSMLIFSAKKEKSIKYTWVVYLAFFAALCDWFENTVELFFIKNMMEFPSTLFFMHSTVSALKWMALPVVIVYIVVLLGKRDSIANKSLER